MLAAQPHDEFRRDRRGHRDGLNPPGAGPQQQGDTERGNDRTAHGVGWPMRQTLEKILAGEAACEGKDDLRRMDAEIADPCSCSKENPQEQDLRQARIDGGIAPARSKRIYPDFVFHRVQAFEALNEMDARSCRKSFAAEVTAYGRFQVRAPSVVAKTRPPAVEIAADDASAAETATRLAAVGELILCQCSPPSVVRRTIPWVPTTQHTSADGAAPAVKSVPTPLVCRYHSPSVPQCWIIPPAPTRQRSTPSGVLIATIAAARLAVVMPAIGAPDSAVAASDASAGTGALLAPKGARPRSFIASWGGAGGRGGACAAVSVPSAALRASSFPLSAAGEVALAARSGCEKKPAPPAIGWISLGAAIAACC